jgi:ParB family chromosome partitioning protein
MNEPAPEIRSVPIDLHHGSQPAVRNKRIFQELVNSIAHLGLKKPITVSKRPGKTRFDLVCGRTARGVHRARPDRDPPS